MAQTWEKAAKAEKNIKASQAKPAAAPPVPVPAVAPSTTDQAFQSIQGILTAAGLGDPAIVAVAWNDYKNGITDPNLVLADVRKSAAYQTAYPNAAQIFAQGSITNEAQYQNYISTAREAFHAAGLPDGFYDSPSELSQAMLGGTSLSELQQRISDAGQAQTAFLDPAAKSEFQRQTGVTDGELTAQFLDPNANLPSVENKLKASLIGAAGDNAGYGQVDTATLQQLAANGVTASQASNGFGTLAGEQQLFNPLAGGTGPTITQAQQLDAQFDNNAQDSQLIEAQRRARLAALNGSTSVASSSAGVVGLGANQT